MRKNDEIIWRQDTKPPRPFSWWVAQADCIGGACPKCSGPTHGQYLPPSRHTMNECAVVEHCRICGWEHAVITGMSGRPYDTPVTPREVRPVGAFKARSNHNTRSPRG